MNPGRWALAAVMALGVVSCSEDEPTVEPDTERTAPPTSPPESTTPTASGLAETTPTEPPPEVLGPPRFDQDAALQTVRRLAGRIGPREAASPEFERAADWVADRFTDLGYDVERQPVRVPAGVSWGVLVDAGRTWNVIAPTAELRPGDPYRIVGAHLDTVPQAPGAEDNASGISVLLELARLAASTPPRLPVVFVAFGGEEPRGDGDDDHHFGSTAYVEQMSGRQRRSLDGMVSLDRVGVGAVVPVCSGGLEPPGVRRSLLRTAERMDIPAQPCENQASDHWSFDKAGLPAARIGSTPYAEYHSAADRPGVVQPRQLARVGRIMWEWLGGS
ncbi:MAG TPA: M28 family peptidase [Nocardioidaceae bacterium]|nr:M28 family peptidase [Nocardioidaceae bacterium]